MGTSASAMRQTIADDASIPALRSLASIPWAVRKRYHETADLSARLGVGASSGYGAIPLPPNAYKAGYFHVQCYRACYDRIGEPDPDPVWLSALAV